MADDNNFNKNKLPKGIATWQSVPFFDVSFFGKTKSKDENGLPVIFGIHRKDRRGNTYVVGKTGTGKSSLLEILLRQDISNNIPAIFIDQSSKNFEKIVKFAKEMSVTGLEIFDPSQESSYLWNPFYKLDKIKSKQLTENLITIFKKQLKDFWNPKVEFLFRQIIQTVCVLDNANLETGYRLLTDINFREETLPKLKSEPGLLAFWSEEYSQWEKVYSSEAVIPVKTRLDNLVNDPLLKIFFSNQETKTPLEIMQKKGLFLVNLLKNQIGIEDSIVLETIILSSLNFYASFYGQDKKEALSTKNDCQLYIDDFTFIPHALLENLLEESYNNRMFLTIVHSGVDALNSTEHNLIISRSKNIISFRLNIEDAQKTRAEFLPFFDTKDFTSLEDRNFYAKISVHEKTADPFSGESLELI